MTRFWISITLALSLSASADARTRNVSINVDDDGVVASCDQLKVRFSDGPGFRAEEQVAVGRVSSLRIEAAQNGGVYAMGGSSYSVKACKAAEVESTLRNLRVSVNGNQVTAAGPGDDNWVVYFLVTVPRNGSLDLESHNGPISLRDVVATVNARAINGPIGVKNSSGTMDLDTENGPISLTGGSGTVKLNAQNGPISVKLEGNTWDGSLDARTQNGPLSLKVPRDFRSGLVVESDGHGPMNCRAEACRGARKTWDDDDARRIEIGSGPTVVHMSTVNGPVSVKE